MALQQDQMDVSLSVNACLLYQVSVSPANKSILGFGAHDDVKSRRLTVFLQVAVKIPQALLKAAERCDTVKEPSELLHRMKKQLRLLIDKKTTADLMTTDAGVSKGEEARLCRIYTLRFLGAMDLAKPTFCPMISSAMLQISSAKTKDTRAVSVMSC